MSTAHTNLDINKYAQIQAKELSNAQKLQIESATIEHYKKSSKYKNELKDYTIGAYLICLDEVT